MREEVPATAGAQAAEDGVDDLAYVRGPRPPSTRFGKHKGSDQFPLSISEIGGISRSLWCRHEVSPSA
jgi:hypothetical protein